MASPEEAGAPAKIDHPMKVEVEAVDNSALNASTNSKVNKAPTKAAALNRAVMPGTMNQEMITNPSVDFVAEVEADEAVGITTEAAVVTKVAAVVMKEAVVATKAAVVVMKEVAVVMKEAAVDTKEAGVVRMKAVEADEVVDAVDVVTTTVTPAKVHNNNSHKNRKAALGNKAPST